MPGSATDGVVSRRGPAWPSPGLARPLSLMVEALEFTGNDSGVAMGSHRQQLEAKRSLAPFKLRVESSESFHSAGPGAGLGKAKG